MFCTHLALTNFRNYAHLDLDLSSPIVVFIGDNAQGKSNLLESFYLLATTKSFRSGSDRELINWHAAACGLPFARVTAQVQRDRGPVKMDIVVGEEQRRLAEAPADVATAAVAKRFKVNGAAHRALEVIGQVNVVLFTPQDLDLVTGPPSGRRRYLDILISQVDPRYVRSLSHYQRVLQQRNHLLRQIRDRRARSDQLEFWDDELVGSGSYVLARRREVVVGLDGLALVAHRDLAGGLEALRIGYRSTVPSVEIAPAAPAAEAAPVAEVAAAFREAVAATRARETALGVSLVGPHRDDLVVQLDGRDIGVYGSRGQQRTAVLAMKLAESQLMERFTGERPIVLLDDVLSELDERRRRHVLEVVKAERQVILTATDLSVFADELGPGLAIWRVAQGIVAPERAAVPAI